MAIADAKSASQSWADIEAGYRTKAEDWVSKGAFYDSIITNLTKTENISEDKAKLRQLRTLTVASSKCAVQAVKFYELADRAKDMAWQDEYGDKIDLIDSENKS